MLNFVLLLISPVIIFMILLFGFIGYNFLHLYYKGYRLKENKCKVKRRSIIKRLLYDFPKRLVKDIYLRDPNEFKEYGLHLFCGEQGSGKTVSLVQRIQSLQESYPQMKVRTNMGYLYEDGQIQHWKDLVECTNGIFGQVEVLDEIQTWFSSNQSKNFPPEMLTEISQQRKQRKMLVGTAQVFSRVSKPIREQVSFVYLPITILGCMTIVRVSKPQYWNDEKQIFKKYTGVYFFVHNDRVRDSFDTYKKIKKYVKAGFKKESLNQI